MLAYLHIRNIALIEELEIDFVRGLNILTGETGAGKSILLGSIQYVLGAKVKRDFIRDGANEASVECIFDLSDNQLDAEELNAIFDEYGLVKDEAGIMISRKTSGNGRSVFRINGDLVRQDVVTRLAQVLIDVHSQKEHQSLLSKRRQQDMLDRYIGDALEEPMNRYMSLLKEYQSLKKSIHEDHFDDEKRRREIAFLEFEIHEIVEANLKLGEDQEVEARFEVLSNQSNVADTLHRILNDLFGEPDISYLLSKAAHDFDKILRYEEQLVKTKDALVQVEDIIHDARRDIIHRLDRMEDVSEELFYLQERLDTMNKLKMKYGSSIEEIMNYLNRKEEEHRYLVNYEEELQKIKARFIQLEKELVKVAKHISELRKEGAKDLSEKITLALCDLNLKNAKLFIEIHQRNEFLSRGMDSVEFLITTNKGEVPKDLSEVASGGEISRVMLAMKSILARVDGVDTLIFDEIDTGISGQTAQMVAQKMRALSNERQLICITHLPQIAAMADAHYQIRKEVVGEKTLSFVEALTEEESIAELARIMSGAITSDTVMANARELKTYANQLKKK